MEAQYRLGKQYGIYTKDNIDLLRRGRAPIVTKGKYSGEKLHVDHILPYADYPELENSMANLSWLPASVNLKKSARLTNAAKRRARQIMEETGWALRWAQ